MMDSLSALVSSVVDLCTSITVLGIPIIIWEFVCLFFSVIVRILFGASGRGSGDNVK